MRFVVAKRGVGLRIDAARNYERIVVAADRAFEESGSTVTLDEVARRAGIGIATVYRRFRNRDQLLRAVFDHILITEIEPTTTVHTSDPRQDLVDSLTATVDVLAQRRAILALAKDSNALGVESLHRYVRATTPLLRRAIEAGVVRPELDGRDLAAIVIMALATTHPGDRNGADRSRYLALLLDGTRPTTTTLPPLTMAAPLPESCQRSASAADRPAESGSTDPS